MTSKWRQSLTFFRRDHLEIIFVKRATLSVFHFFISSSGRRVHLENKVENIYQLRKRDHLAGFKKKNDLPQCDKSTNRGLISEDRSTEATLLFTIPRSCLSRLHRIYL